MEIVKQERVLAYTVAIPLDQHLLEQVSGGASPGPSPTARVIFTGNNSCPDVVIEI